MKTFPIFFRQLPRKTSQWNCFFFFFFSLLLFFPALRFCSVSAYFRMRVAVRRAIVFPGNLLWRNVPCNKFYRRLAFKPSGVLPFLLLNRHPILYIMHIRIPEVRLESCCRYTLIVAEIVEKFSRIRYYIWVLNWKFHSLNFRVNFRIIILFYIILIMQLLILLIRNMYIAISMENQTETIQSYLGHIILEKFASVAKEFQECREWGSMSLYPCTDDRRNRGAGRGGEEGMGARRLICRQWSGPGIDDEVSEAFEVRRASRRGSQPFESLGVLILILAAMHSHFVCRYLSVPSVLMPVRN